jgi:hypothetical protein
VLYQVIATATIKTNDGDIVHQIPTFYLSGRLLGITNVNHAHKFVPDVVNPSHNPNMSVHSHIVTVHGTEDE